MNAKALAQNTNGFPGVWLPAIPHGLPPDGNHTVGCNGDTKPFYPIHGALIPTGTYQGWVLVWEKGEQPNCGHPLNPQPSVNHDADRDQRWAILHPPTGTIHKFAWRINTTDAPQPPCAPLSPPFSALGNQAIFCSGHCWLPDGRLLVAGGDDWETGPCGPNADFAGTRMLAVFNPNHISVTLPPYQLTNGPALGSPWTSLSPTSAGGLALRKARWYPSVTLMAPAVLSPTSNPFVYISVAGGVEYMDLGPPVPVLPTVTTSSDPSFSTHELFLFDIFQNIISRDPRAPSPSSPTGLFPGPTTPLGGGFSFLYYPRLHFMSARPGSPDGRLWMAGMSVQSTDGDIINTPGTWNNAGSVLSIGANNSLIEEATVVLFPPITPAYRDVQMIIGGMKTDAQHSGSNITNEVQFMVTRTNPGWVPGISMNLPRKFANAVILPDASIVVIGGGTNAAHGAPGGGQLAAEMFVNGNWQMLSDQLSERTYHSIAMLLPDGRVLSAGGDSHTQGAEYEIFVPPYLEGNPARPAFVGVQQTTIHYGQQDLFAVSAPFGQSIERVVLISPGSVTHSQDSNQRYEPLSFEPDPNGTADILVTAPANATLAPPGFS